MNSILERLFQESGLFPLSPEEERQLGVLGDEVERRKQNLENQLEGDLLSQLEVYLERQEEFHDKERRLAYENGFLLAMSLWLEVWGRLEGAEP